MSRGGTRVRQWRRGAEGWSKHHLARWLLGPYRYAACPLQGTEHDTGTASRVAVVPARIDRLLHAVRSHVLTALESSPDGLVGLPCWSISAGSLLRSRHDNGETGFIPVDWPRMRLEHRVMSLFAVDCLVRGDDYETKLVVCRRCRHVAFDEVLHATGLCERHHLPSKRASGVHLNAEIANLTEIVLPSKDRRAL